MELVNSPTRNPRKIQTKSSMKLSAFASPLFFFPQAEDLRVYHFIPNLHFFRPAKVFQAIFQCLENYRQSGLE